MSSCPRPFAALLALGVMSAALSGCNGQEVSRVVEAVVIAIILIIVIQLITWAAMVVILMVNLVRLGRGKPSLRWGAAGILAGAFTGMPAISMIASHFHVLTLGSLALSGALVFFGYKNVVGARDVRRWKRLGDEDDP